MSVIALIDPYWLLGRELTQGERVTLRRRFREILLAPVPAHL